MTRNVALSALAGGLVSLAAAMAVAQDSAVLDDLYGRGVHSYFSRDSRKAYELLTEAIDNGSRDPRAYYFRGLALRNLGRDDDAAIDFREGAKFEQGGDLTLDVVSKSLERVQGTARMQIENYRRIARLQRRNERLAREKARYEDLQAEDEVVVRKPNKKPVAPPAVLPEASDPDASDPFGDDAAAKPAVDPVEKPEPSETPEPADDTVPPPAKPATKPAADPFGDEPAEEPPAKPATKPAADPFGDEPAEEPPAKPAAKPAADPFGDEPEAAPEKPAVEPDEAAPEAAAAPPAAKPGKAGRSLFSALTKAILPAGEANGKPAAAPAAAPGAAPAAATDPFADDEAPATEVKPAPAAKQPAPPAEEVEDPFK